MYTCGFRHWLLHLWFSLHCTHLHTIIEKFTFKRIHQPCSAFFFFWEGRSATTGFQPVSSGKDAFTHEPHEEEQCETRALIAHAAEQATIAPTHYSLKPHPWALTRRAGRSARYLPRMLRAEDQIAVCTMRICQCMEGRRLAGMLTLQSPASAKVGPDEATTEFGGHWVMTPRAEACPANVGPTP